MDKKIKKVLLMGKSGSGKTSMRSIIFANYIARETTHFRATLDVEHSHVRFLGNLNLNLWDCGGQDNFMDRYLEEQRDHIFCNVKVLIYVFDVKSSEHKKDMAYYRECIDAIMQNSKDAKVFCLIHKMDLITNQQERHRIYRERVEELTEKSKPKDIRCFATSIWDETLYQCWSDIIYSLIPNIKMIEKRLDNFTKICGADECLLLEKATFLIIAHSSSKELHDVHRFEKISNIIKKFKLSCTKSSTMFQSIQIQNNKFQAFIEQFTNNTYVMVIISDSNILKATTLLNIQIARAHFEALISRKKKGIKSPVKKKKKKKKNMGYKKKKKNGLNNDKKSKKKRSII